LSGFNFRRRAIDKKKDIGRGSKSNAVGCRLKRRKKRKRDRRNFEEGSENESKTITGANKTRGVKNRVDRRSKSI